VTSAVEEGAKRGQGRLLQSGAGCWERGELSANVAGLYVWGCSLIHSSDALQVPGGACGLKVHWSACGEILRTTWESGSAETGGSRWRDTGSGGVHG